MNRVRRGGDDEEEEDDGFTAKADADGKHPIVQHMKKNRRNIVVVVIIILFSLSPYFVVLSLNRWRFVMLPSVESFPQADVS